MVTQNVLKEPKQENLVPLPDIIQNLCNGDALLKHTPTNVMEVVGILDSYGVVLDAYSNNLNYIAENTFLDLFPFFKYFNGTVSRDQLFRHLQHNRINYEYAEYCMKGMLWHGGGGLDSYVDTPEFEQNVRAAVEAKKVGNPILKLVDKFSPDFALEQARQLAYYSGLGQFWRVMSDIFVSLAEEYGKGNIKVIPDVVTHVLNGLVADAARPITYAVEIGGKKYDLMPKSAGLTFLMDTGVPYVEAIFFRGTPFPGTISYNAQAEQIDPQPSTFTYGALYADPLPIGSAGIPPTLLMEDMRRYLPDYLLKHYQEEGRQEGDILIKCCQSFQKSMFCVTTAAIKGLAPHPLDTTDPEEQKAVREYLAGWMQRLSTSQIRVANG
ncbi:MAG: CO2 hydration protein [Cyanobacteria bacterium P01_D01_bin.73]